MLGVDLVCSLNSSKTEKKKKKEDEKFISVIWFKHSVFETIPTPKMILQQYGDNRR